MSLSDKRFKFDEQWKDAFYYEKSVKEFIKKILERWDMIDKVFAIYYTDDEIKKGFKVVKMPKRQWIKLKQEIIKGAGEDLI